jgi:anti-anti-sigma regulatory factor
LAIRITTEAGQTATTIQIEGHLTGADLPGMRTECESASPPLRLDLSGLMSVDDDGIQALLALAEAGAQLHGANPYIRQLLIDVNK